MESLITALKDASSQQILIVAGLFIIVLGLVSKLGGFIEVRPSQQKFAIFIGCGVLISGLLLGLHSNPQPDTPVTAASVSSGQTLSPSPSASPSVSPSANDQPVGWIRLGAVNTAQTNAQDNAPLVERNQPVTVDPPIVPKDGASVTILSSVNIRKGPPQGPERKLQDKISSLSTGARVSIVQKSMFADPKDPAYMIVWAEIRLVK